MLKGRYRLDEIAQMLSSELWLTFDVFHVASEVTCGSLKALVFDYQAQKYANYEEDGQSKNFEYVMVNKRLVGDTTYMVEYEELKRFINRYWGVEEAAPIIIEIEPKQVKHEEETVYKESKYVKRQEAVTTNMQKIIALVTRQFVWG